MLCIDVMSVMNAMNVKMWNGMRGREIGLMNKIREEESCEF